MCNMFKLPFPAIVLLQQHRGYLLSILNLLCKKIGFGTLPHRLSGLCKLCKSVALWTFQTFLFTALMDEIVTVIVMGSVGDQVT